MKKSTSVILFSTFALVCFYFFRKKLGGHRPPRPLPLLRHWIVACRMEYFIPNPFPHICCCLCSFFSWVGSIKQIKPTLCHTWAQYKLHTRQSEISSVFPPKFHFNVLRCRCKNSNRFSKFRPPQYNCRGKVAQIATKRLSVR